MERHAMGGGLSLSSKSQSSVLIEVAFMKITAEVFPTHIRSICVAIYAAFGNWLWVREATVLMEQFYLQSIG